MAATTGSTLKGDEYGLIDPYLGRFFFEELDYKVDESIFYRHGDEKLPNTFEVVKRFLKQVRESRGYDVDCCPPGMLNTPFLPIPVDAVRKHPSPGSKTYYARILLAAQSAIDKINADTSSNFKLVDIEKAVNTRCLVMLLTFTAKKDVDNAPLQTFQSSVYVPFGGDPEVGEWKPKSSPDSSWE